MLLDQPNARSARRPDLGLMANLAVNRFRVVWSGTGRFSPISPSRDPTSSSVRRSGWWKTALRINDVSLARSE
jgi:hypothetical protein